MLIVVNRAKDYISVVDSTSKKIIDIPNNEFERVLLMKGLIPGVLRTPKGLVITPFYPSRRIKNGVYVTSCIGYEVFSRLSYSYISGNMGSDRVRVEEFKLPRGTKSTALRLSTGTVSEISGVRVKLIWRVYVAFDENGKTHLVVRRNISPLEENRIMDSRCDLRIYTACKESFLRSAGMSLVYKDACSEVLSPKYGKFNKSPEPYMKVYERPEYIVPDISSGRVFNF